MKAQKGIILSRRTINQNTNIDKPIYINRYPVHFGARFNGGQGWADRWQQVRSLSAASSARHQAMFLYLKCLIMASEKKTHKKKPASTQV